MLGYLEAIERLIAEIRAVEWNYQSPEFAVWRRETIYTLRQIFGEQSEQVREFSSILFRPAVQQSTSSTDLPADVFQTNLQFARRLLESMVSQAESRDPVVSERENKIMALKPEQNRKVFMIFGHDIDLKDQVMNYLYRLGLKPMALNEQAGGGRTLIQMLHENANVAYAVALLTADDIGTTEREFREKLDACVAQIEETSQLASALKPRARQNVIFELGLFQGFHGQGKACVIVGKDRLGRRVEIPSDLSGVRYLPVEGEGNEGLFGLLRKELLKAGLPIDLHAG